MGRGGKRRGERGEDEGKGSGKSIMASGGGVVLWRLSYTAEGRRRRKKGKRKREEGNSLGGEKGSHVERTNGLMAEGMVDG